MLHTLHTLINEQAEFLYKNSTTGRGEGKGREMGEGKGNILNKIPQKGSL